MGGLLRGKAAAQFRLDQQLFAKPLLYFFSPRRGFALVSCASGRPVISAFSYSLMLRSVFLLLALLFENTQAATAQAPIRAHTFTNPLRANGPDP